MHRHSAPIACKPWALNGLSERLLVSHYENNYGTVVRSLNATHDQLHALDLATAPRYQARALKREELVAMGSIAVHELYFASLGGDGAVLFTGTGEGTKLAEHLSTALEQGFDSVGAWRREFVALTQSLDDGSGWVLLSYSRRDRRSVNQIAFDHSQVAMDAVPVLVLDMYEHAYQRDFGVYVNAYSDPFMRNIDWTAVGDRPVAARLGQGESSHRHAVNDPLTSISVEDLSVEIGKNGPIQVLDVRPKHYFSRGTDTMESATWRDPDRIDDWWSELSINAPVFVYCAYGYHVSRGVTEILRRRGFEAKYIRGGLSA